MPSGFDHYSRLLVWNRSKISPKWQSSLIVWVCHGWWISFVVRLSALHSIRPADWTGPVGLKSTKISVNHTLKEVTDPGVSTRLAYLLQTRRRIVVSSVDWWIIQPYRINIRIIYHRLAGFTNIYLLHLPGYSNLMISSSDDFKTGWLHENSYRS